MILILVIQEWDFTMWFNKSPFEWAFCNKSFNINWLCSHLWEKNFKHDSMMLPHSILANTSHDIALFKCIAAGLHAYMIQPQIQFVIHLHIWSQSMSLDCTYNNFLYVSSHHCSPWKANKHPATVNSCSQI